MAIGPLVGGYLVDAAGWRSIFWLNVPLAALVIWLTVRHVPESRGADDKLDLVGASLTAGGLALLTYGLVDRSWPYAVVGMLVLVGLVAPGRR